MGGYWIVEEQEQSINSLELLVTFLGLQTFTSTKRKVVILLRLNNVTTMAYLNKMGGPHSDCLSRLAVKVWNWWLHREILIHAEHLPGKENIQAN